MSVVSTEKRALEELTEAQGVINAVLLDGSLPARLAAWAQTCADCIAAGGIVFFAGNGGSFADAQHLAGELTGKLGRKRPSFAAVALGSNASALTAIANDYEYDEVFAREFRGLQRQPSVVILLSTSGRSPNILRLAQEATLVGVPVLGLSGGDGGLLAEVGDCIAVPSRQTARIQEVHKLFGHVLCLLIEERLAGTFFEWDE